MDGTGLTRRTPSAVYVPRVARIASTRWTDTVSVRLLHGQTPADLQDRAEGLRHVFGAYRATVARDRPRPGGSAVLRPGPADRPRAAVGGATGPSTWPGCRSGGPRRAGRYRLRLTGTHVLVAGATGAGKGSVVWSILSALVPGIRGRARRRDRPGPQGRDGAVPGPALFTHYADDSPEAMVDCLEAAVDRMLARRDRLRTQGLRVFTPTPGTRSRSSSSTSWRS